MPKNYGRQLNAMDDDELERFVNDWLARRTETYVGHERFSSSGDMGRDVVGYCTDRRMDGPWHNYQCKQLLTRLGEPKAINELGKIFYHSSQGHFGLPSKYIFVAPRGVVRTVKELIAQPSKFAQRIIDQWDSWCATEIVKNQRLQLTDEIRRLILAFDFASVDALDAAKLVKEERIRPVLVDWFNEDPGEAPRGSAPDEVQQEEALFLTQLLGAYGEKAGSAFATAENVLADMKWGMHLRLQRNRYFEAAAFKRYYRDNTPERYISNLEDDVYNGVIEVHLCEYPALLDRVDKVMLQAAQVSPSGVLAKYARVAVKQGICHHFANEGRWSWVP